MTPDGGPADDRARRLRDATPVALGALLRWGASFGDAEDAVQEAVAIALEAWPRTGTPERPVGWLVRVAQRRLVARHRSDTARQRREALVASWSSRPPEPAPSEDDPVALLFLCCDPVLPPASAIPLTLRAVGGLSTREIADALLVPEATVAQRISRAKATIRATPEPFRRPGGDELAARLPAVLQIVYLIFTGGHAASRGDEPTRTDLAEEALRLARRLHRQLPDHPETTGLLALLLLTDARRAARTDEAGALVPLDRQDRRRWDRAAITEGLRLLTGAFAHHDLGEYQLQAAIAAVHDGAPTFEETDWVRIRALYDLLVARTDNPLARLNRAVAVAHTDGPAAALAEVGGLADRLGEHHRFHATVGHLHQLAGDGGAARVAYRAAADRATNDAERRYLLERADDDAAR